MVCPHLLLLLLTLSERGHATSVQLLPSSFPSFPYTTLLGNGPPPLTPRSLSRSQPAGGQLMSTQPRQALPGQIRALENKEVRSSVEPDAVAEVHDGGPSERKRPRLEVEAKAPQPEVDEASLWFWLKQQQHAGLPVNPTQLLDNKGPTDLNKNGVVDGSWFWRWYKRFGYTHFPQVTNSDAGLQKANGHSVPLVSSTVRSTLDSVLLHKDNNNVDSPGKTEESDDDDEEEDEPPATAAEAVGHGEKFLRWLECCSDPSVTAMQILQFRYLLNNVRACADRRAKQTKTKTRSRRK
ncbi:hypothetical protein C0J52_05965 [Blattella germanica]|nr:hypothetical protein C0J52_05965 [Blattella germanica]